MTIVVLFSFIGAIYGYVTISRDSDDFFECVWGGIVGGCGWLIGSGIMYVIVHFVQKYW